MDALKIRQLIKNLEALESHLENSQGDELKSLLDKTKSPLEDMGLPTDGKPKGIAIEKVKIIGKPKGESFDDKVNDAIEGQEPESESLKLPGEEELSDDELEELAKRLARK